MVSISILCFPVMLALVSAGWSGHGGGCPYLRKVVPPGQIYMDIASEFLHHRTTDCKAFALQFAEHANITKVCGKTGQVRQINTRDGIQHMCDSHQLPPGGTVTLTSIFPEFSKSGMLFEVDFQALGTSGSGLCQLHFCSKTKKVISAKMLQGESSNLPESLRQVSNRLLKATFENHDCRAYADLMEADASLEFNGEPKLVTHGDETTFKGLRQAQAACEQKAAREKRVILSSSAVGKKYFYDAMQKELTMVAEKRTEVIFRPGQKRAYPIAMVLQFSDSGKIKAVRFYETEALHIEQKWGLQYGASDSSKRDFTYHAQGASKTVAENGKPETKEDSTNAKTVTKNGKPETKEDSTNAKVVTKNGKPETREHSTSVKVATTPEPVDVDIEHALVGAFSIKELSLSSADVLASTAADVRGASWCWMALLVLSCAIVRN